MPDINRNQTGSRLRKIRKDLRMEQRSFAEFLEIGQSQLSRIENGVYEIQNDHFIKLGRLGYDLNWLILGEGSMKKERFVQTVEPADEHNRMDKIERFLKDHFTDFK
jgi:transcriptional regulator with XRE-family HTH domain